MGECQFCGDPSTLDLDTKPVCYDCLQRVGDDPEARFSAVLNSLITLHARLCQVGQHGYASNWAKDLARRIEVCRRNELMADIAQAVSDKVPAQAVTEVAAFIDSDLIAEAVISGALNETVKRKRSGALKIRK